MKYSQLIAKCIELIDTYNENIMTPDSHATQFLTNLKCQDTERVFLKQVFYGVQRYKGFLKASNNLIFQMNSTMTNRKNDTTLFSVFTYLICFRLDQLPFAEFKKIVLSQDMVKMHVLLGFIFDFKTLEEKVLDAWSQHLERPYLEQKLLPKLAQRKQKCDELIAKVQQLATGKKALDSSSLNNTQNNIDDFGKDKKKATVPKQFNLTKPKPKMLPQPIVIDVGFKANPVPKTNKDLKKIQQEKKKRRQQIKDNIKKFYDQKKTEEFDFQTSKRPLNLPKIKQQVQLQETKQLNKKVMARPMPKYNDVDVKLNVAAILRQEKKLNEKIQEEEERMRNLQINMRDESEYENWKKQMKQKDQFEAMQQQQRRKIEMELARQAAIKAYQEKIEEKRNLVDDMKQISFQLRDQRQKLEQEMLQNKKNLVQEVQQSKQNIAIERQKVVENNKKIRDQEVEERRRILQKKREEERIELQKKKQLIQQIRELEKSIRAKPKQQIQYVSIGLLEEMTLQQLRDRLDNVKRQRKQQQERRRQQNIKKKEQFKSTISQKKDTIMAARQSLAKQKEQQRQKKKMQAQMEKQRLQQAKKKSLMEYKKKQEQKQQEKKKQKQRLAKEQKQTEQRRMFLAQGQAAQQANAFKNLQKGQQREILDRQNTKLIEQYKLQSIKQGQRKILADQNKRAVQKKIQFNKLYNQQQEFNNRMAEDVQREDQVTKAMKFHEVKTFEQKHTQNMTKTNPYKTKIAQMSLTNGKSFQKNIK